MLDMIAECFARFPILFGIILLIVWFFIGGISCLVIAGVIK